LPSEFNRDFPQFLQAEADRELEAKNTSIQTLSKFQSYTFVMLSVLKNESQKKVRVSSDPNNSLTFLFIHGKVN
jgi:hypothetical protein